MPDKREVRYFRNLWRGDTLSQGREKRMEYFDTGSELAIELGIWSILSGQSTHSRAHP